MDLEQDGNDCLPSLVMLSFLDLSRPGPAVHLASPLASARAPSPHDSPSANFGSRRQPVVVIRTCCHVSKAASLKYTLILLPQSFSQRDTTPSIPASGVLFALINMLELNWTQAVSSSSLGLLTPRTQHLSLSLPFPFSRNSRAVYCSIPASHSP